MSIYLLRHEERYDNPGYFTTLTVKGRKKSQELSNTLNEIDFDTIYCSPFLRTIETIYPYVRQYKKKVNIEYALYEFIRKETFTMKNYLHNVYEFIDYAPEYPCFPYINHNYISFIRDTDIHYPETYKSIYDRIQPFIDNIIENIGEKKILLVTHMSTFNMIKNYIQLQTFSDNDPKFPMGTLEKVL